MNKHHHPQLILAGGGHSHLVAIPTLVRQLGDRVRITLLSRDRYTAYSGMIPAVIAGHYPLQAAMIDLLKVARHYHIQWIQDEVINIDPDQQQLITARNGKLAYDALSLDLGSSPAVDSISGADRFGVGVKPVSALLEHCEQWLGTAEGKQITVIGGGVSSIEVLLALHYRSLKLKRRHQFRLIGGSPVLLPDHNRTLRAAICRLLTERGIEYLCGQRVVAVSADALTLDSGRVLPSDYPIWALPAKSQAWLRTTALNTTAAGFVLVNDCLQSSSHPSVFAAGDIAEYREHTLPKSGVVAVRQGPVLARNLARHLADQPLTPYRPQSAFLNLIASGGRHALASRGNWFAQGEWVWHWKQWLDRRFVARFK